MNWLAGAYRSLQPAPNYREEYRVTSEALADAQMREQRYRADYMERAAELIEAKQMSGAGPWLVHESRGKINTPGANLRESMPVASQGAFGDIELALQNVEWRRQVNLSWLEFSRWGIQQIILISRLYYLKNPICRRLVDVCANYTFALGVEVSSNDDAANEVLEEFFTRNRAVLGQNALVNHERSLDTDGNLFFVFFSDKADKGQTTVRTIDATEIADIICDPDDADTPWYYRRTWDQRNFDTTTGAIAVETKSCWYPALNYNPDNKIPTINLLPVMWEQPVLHRKTGAVAKWHFGCPRIYPMLDWAREARRLLESCASVFQSLSQFALKLTTKGGQQAMEGAKAQLSTTVGPTAQLWDQNPPAVRGATFVSGPGTTMEAFSKHGATLDPEYVRQYKLQCCMVKGVPETFLSDVSTGNLATAQSLDRPTETMFMQHQEAWREILETIAKYVLGISQGAPSGSLRESASKNRAGVPYRIREAKRAVRSDTNKRIYEKSKPSDESGDIEIRVEFPNIREGDNALMINAVVQAMTLGNRGGQVTGIDEKEGIILLLKLAGVEDSDEIAEAMFPEADYNPNRSEQMLTAPISIAKPSAGGQPQIDPRTGQPMKPAGVTGPTKDPRAVVEKIAAANDRLARALQMLEKNGNKTLAE